MEANTTRVQFFIEGKFVPYGKEYTDLVEFIKSLPEKKGSFEREFTKGNKVERVLLNVKYKKN